MIEKDENNIEALERCIRNLDGKLKEREIYTLIKVFDGNETRKIDKDDFDRVFAKASQAFRVDSIIKTRKPRTRYSSEGKIDPIFSEKQAIIKKYEIKGQKLIEFLNTIETDKQGRVSIPLFSRGLSNYFPHINKEDILALLNYFDLDKDSLLRLQDIEDFVRDNSKSKNKLKNLFKNIAKKLQEINVATLEYFKSQRFKEVMTEAEFREKIEILFEISKENSKLICSFLNVQGLGRILTKNFATILNTYRKDTKLNDSEIEKTTKDLLETPRTLYISTIEELTEKLSRINMNPMDLFKMADKKNKRLILLDEFKEILLELCPDISETLMVKTENLFPKKTINPNDIISIFKLNNAKLKTENDLKQASKDSVLDRKQLFTFNNINQKINLKNSSSARSMKNLKFSSSLSPKSTEKSLSVRNIVIHSDKNNVISKTSPKIVSDRSHDKPPLRKIENIDVSAYKKPSIPFLIQDSYDKPSLEVIADVITPIMKQDAFYVINFNSKESSFSSPPNESPNSFNIFDKSKPKYFDVSSNFSSKISSRKPSSRVSSRNSSRVNSTEPIKVELNSELLGNPRISLLFAKFIHNCPQNTPVHEYFKNFGIFAVSLISLERYLKLCQKFNILTTEANQMFTVLDTHNKGIIYGYSLFAVVESLRSNFSSFPVLHNPNTNPDISKILKNSVVHIDPKIPLFKQLVDPEEIISD